MFMHRAWELAGLQNNIYHAVAFSSVLKNAFKVQIGFNFPELDASGQRNRKLKITADQVPHTNMSCIVKGNLKNILQTSWI